MASIDRSIDWFRSKVHTNGIDVVIIAIEFFFLSLLWI
jgi:hypothetical protein